MIKLRRLLSICPKKNIKLNAGKMQLRRTGEPYIGHLLTSGGLRPNPKKVRDVREMFRSKDVKGVQHLIGLANYLSKFYAHLSDACEPLRVLKQNNTAWECSA